MSARSRSVTFTTAAVGVGVCVVTAVLLFSAVAAVRVASGLLCVEPDERGTSCVDSAVGRDWWMLLGFLLVTAVCARLWGPTPLAVGGVILAFASLWLVVAPSPHLSLHPADAYVCEPLALHLGSVKGMSSDRWHRDEVCFDMRTTRAGDVAAVFLAALVVLGTAIALRRNRSGAGRPAWA